MARWRERVEELLYAGESVQETIEVENAHVVVTSHRVLAFTPEADGPNFRGVDRPNVVGVDTGAQSQTGLLERALKFGVVGAVLVGAGWILDFGSMIGDVDLSGGGAAGRVGLGGIMETMGVMIALLRNLDQYMQLFGALALLLAAVLLGVFWFLRDPTLVIEIEGEDDIQLPRPRDASDAIERIERAIAPGPASGNHASPSSGKRPTSETGVSQGNASDPDDFL